MVYRSWIATQKDTPQHAAVTATPFTILLTLHGLLMCLNKARVHILLQLIPVDLGTGLRTFKTPGV